MILIYPVVAYTNPIFALDRLVFALVSSMVAGYGTTDLHYHVAESGTTIFLASGERCRSDDKRVQDSEFVDKA